MRSSIWLLFVWVVSLSALLMNDWYESRNRSEAIQNYLHIRVVCGSGFRDEPCTVQQVGGTADAAGEIKK